MITDRFCACRDLRRVRFACRDLRRDSCPVIVAPAPVIEYVSSAPVIENVAPAPAVTVDAPSQRYTPLPGIMENAGAPGSECVASYATRTKFLVLQHGASKMKKEKKTYEPPEQNFITIGAEHFRCAEVLLLSGFAQHILLHNYRREEDCSGCSEEAALHRFGLLHTAQIDCQGEDLPSPRRKHHLCRC